MPPTFVLFHNIFDLLPCIDDFFYTLGAQLDAQKSNECSSIIERWSGGGGGVTGVCSFFVDVAQSNLYCRLFASQCDQSLRSQAVSV